MILNIVLESEKQFTWIPFTGNILKLKYTSVLLSKTNPPNIWIPWFDVILVVLSNITPPKALTIITLE